MSQEHHVDVYVKAVVITRGGRTLTLFNKAWGGFTLPMTKTRSWPDPDRPGVKITETPQETAIRAAVEALGRPLRDHELPRPHPIHSMEPYKRGGRDGQWKLYHIEVFQIELDADEVPNPYGGVPLAWMTPEDMRTLKPVTSTLRDFAGG